MNPARLIRLFDAKFAPGVRSGHRPEVFRTSAQGGARYVDLSPREDDDDGTRLAAYFLGGD